MTPDDDLRGLLHDAVSDVQPRGTLDDLRSRTEKAEPVAGHNRVWLLPTLAAAAVMAVVVGGAFWLVGNGDDQNAAPSSTAGTADSGPTDPVTPASAVRAVPVYFVGHAAHGNRLYREFQQQRCDDDACVLMAAAAAAVSGAPHDPDHVSGWPAGAHVVHAGYDAGLITVDLAGEVHGITPDVPTVADGELAVQQLIYSVQAAVGQGRVPVQLTIDGKHTDTVLGVPASEPLAAANPDDVLAPVQIDSPGEGDSVGHTFTVTGRAATFEANVVWELKQGDTVVKKGFTTAQECCTLSPYSFRVTAPSGSYTLVVHDTDDSGAGGPVDQDTREITVQ